MPCFIIQSKIGIHREWWPVIDPEILPERAPLCGEDSATQCLWYWPMRSVDSIRVLQFNLDLLSLCLNYLPSHATSLFGIQVQNMVFAFGIPIGIWYTNTEKYGNFWKLLDICQTFIGVSQTCLNVSNTGGSFQSPDGPGPSLDQLCQSLWGGTRHEYS